MRNYLINFLELFYNNDDVYDSGMDDILENCGATENSGEEGLYASMSNGQLEDASLQFLKIYGNKIPEARYLFYLIMNEDNQADYIAGFEAAYKSIGINVQDVKDKIGI